MRIKCCNKHLEDIAWSVAMLRMPRKVWHDDDNDDEDDDNDDGGDDETVQKTGLASLQSKNNWYQLYKSSYMDTTWNDMCVLQH